MIRMTVVLSIILWLFSIPGKAQDSIALPEIFYKRLAYWRESLLLQEPETCRFINAINAIKRQCNCPDETKNQPPQIEFVPNSYQLKVTSMDSIFGRNGRTKKAKKKQSIDDENVVFIWKRNDQGHIRFNDADPVRKAWIEKIDGKVFLNKYIPLKEIKSDDNACIITIPVKELDSFNINSPLFWLFKNGYLGWNSPYNLRLTKDVIRFLDFVKPEPHETVIDVGPEPTMLNYLRLMLLDSVQFYAVHELPESSEGYKMHVAATKIYIDGNAFHYIVSSRKSLNTEKLYCDRFILSNHSIYLIDTKEKQESLQNSIKSGGILIVMFFYEGTSLSEPSQDELAVITSKVSGEHFSLIEELKLPSFYCAKYVRK